MKPVTSLWVRDASGAEAAQPVAGWLTKHGKNTTAPALIPWAWVQAPCLDQPLQFVAVQTNRERQAAAASE
jgi:hypothetical protein